MAVLLDGDALSLVWRAALKRDVLLLRGQGVTPKLATVLIGDDPASLAYVSRKHADCRKVGLESEDLRLSSAIDEVGALKEIGRLNMDRSVHGVLVQRPLPLHLDAQRLQMAIEPGKDVDGLHPLNLAATMLSAPGLKPCAPQAILGLLNAYNISLSGKTVAIIGRGMLVGRPLAVMLADPAVNAAPILLHSGIATLSAVTRNSDVVISAAGVANLVSADMIKVDAVVVGVGISYINGRMVSDIAYDVAQKAAFVTPHHGSIGALTRAMLLRNVLSAATAQGL